MTFTRWKYLQEVGVCFVARIVRYFKSKIGNCRELCYFSSNDILTKFTQRILEGGV